MKYLLSLIMVCCFCIGSKAQNQFISDQRYEEADRIGNLKGKAGILVLSTHNDLVITVTNVPAGGTAPVVTPKGKGVTNYYEYEVVIDKKEIPTPKLEVNRRGDVRRTSFVGKLTANFFTAYLIEEVAKKIGQESLQSAGDAILDQKLSEVELTSSIEDLKVECSPLLKATITTKRQKTDSNISIISIVIPVAVFSEADAALKEAQSAFEESEKKLTAESSDEDWAKSEKLQEELDKKRQERDAMNYITIYAQGTNKLSLDISDLGPRVKKCYGIVPLEKEVHVSKCSGFLKEGGRMFALRKYDEARRAFDQALNADDAPNDLIPAIQSNINQCDTCIIYERYAMGALTKMKQMREKGEGSQEEVVKYASGALDYLEVLNKYNPCDFYSSRISTLNNIIEDMPLVIKFTITKWEKTYSGFSEGGPLGNVEIWAYDGIYPPALNSYKSDRKFRSLTGSSTQYKKIGTTDSQGELELKLVRKSLPTGLMFRPVGYDDKIKINYLDAKEILLQSEGTYNKRQFRMRMYTDD